MATFSTLALKLATRNSKSSLRHRLNVCLSRSYSAAEDGVQTSAYTIVDSEPLDEEERAQLDKLRNVSRLPSNHYKQYHGQPPDLPYKDLYRRRLLYAQFGEASGEDARILWPPRAKLLDQEQEEIEEGSPLLERLAQIQTEKEAAEKVKIERQKQIAKNMSQMPKLIEAYKKKQEAVETAAKERAAKKQALLQEARDFYGYTILANDPKFHKMVEEKELKEKTEKKKRKKEEKLEKLSLREQQLSTAQSGDSKEA